MHLKIGAVLSEIENGKEKVDKIPYMSRRRQSAENCHTTIIVRLLVPLTGND